VDTVVESVHLSGSVAVWASASVFRIHQSFLWEFAPFDESLPVAGNAALTRQTMAGAIYAGLPAGLDAAEATARTRPLGLLQYVYSLATAYHTTHATPPTLRRAAGLLETRAKHVAASRCLRIAEQEVGHDALALKDIAAFGLPAEAFVARVRPRDAFDLLELFSRLADSSEPVGVLGYVYVMERMALRNTAASIEALERLLPPGVRATRCMRVHSSVGRDATHVAESVEVIATLPPEDRRTIARAAFETSSLMHKEASDYPGDQAMRGILKEIGGAEALLAHHGRAI
jgi:hypothetical protein